MPTAEVAEDARIHAIVPGSLTGLLDFGSNGRGIGL